MHELSITQSVVDVCAEHACGQRVTCVTLEVGKLAGVMPEALRFCFDLCAAGTLIEGAELEILETPGRAVCGDCGREMEVADWLGSCRCGSVNLRVVGGQELKIKQMEVA